MSMNSCPYIEKIIDYRLHRLTDEERSSFETHLDSCPSCRHELAIEMAVEDELAAEFQPGLIEQAVMRRLEIQREKDIRSFWLYSYRIAVLGITAAIAIFVLLPYLLKFPRSYQLDMGKYAVAFRDFFAGLAAIDPIFLFMGFGYFLLITSSIYALAQLRR
ncbi:MAG: zf-HC2 domain-containing protein [candidate division WOR-3 bacterium]|nr:MAG: zf-HC2 domain-containing protein [candidate division WOR-3 bacterium]